MELMKKMLSKLCVRTLKEDHLNSGASGLAEENQNIGRWIIINKVIFNYNNEKYF
tara:strand:- start:1535 stop:1699 length:165 start_codon:yes stop_codon:yes gene_type:complete